MAADFSSVDYLRQKVSERLHNMGLLLYELKQELPSFGPKKFADAIIALVEVIRKLFLLEMKQITEEEEIFARCRTYLNLLASLHKNIVSFLESIDDAFIPSELLMSVTDQIKELAKKLGFSTDFDLCLYPIWEFNYGIYAYKDLIRASLAEFPIHLFPDLFKHLPTFPEWFIFITYPRVESRSILLHSLIAHEIGHLVNYQIGISKEVNKIMELHRESLENLIQNEKQRLSWISLPEENLRQTVSEECIKITQKWLEEIVSDLVATHLIGPAFLFALLELSNLNDVVDRNHEDHPCSGLRLVFILQKLDKEGFITRSVNKELKALLLSLYKGFKDRLAQGEFLPRGTEESGYFQVAYNTILRYQSRIVEKVEEKMGILPSFTVDEFNRVVVNLAQELSSGIPPSDFWDESGENKAASFASILNAGWLVWLTRINKFYSQVYATTNSDKLKALDNFNELLFKAVESSYILDKWHECKGGKGS